MPLKNSIDSSWAYTVVVDVEIKSLYLIDIFALSAYSIDMIDSSFRSYTSLLIGDHRLDMSDMILKETAV